ncbi:SAM-dependent methyltransferase [Aurantimonas sp. A2-1-M11]|uniref:class I SAM-dependent methyltransferase n=1 Tax=Aurantimonas sp. A2-1-M11 TaxID=3113712 RepID=UPI002F938EAB
MAKPIDVDGFEAMFAADPDPWRYAASPFERFKRRILMEAVGTRTRGRALELACANGETTAVLGKTSLRLLALDSSPSALAIARERNAGSRQIRFAEAVLPRDMPRGPYDLVVVSELLYYLRPNDLRQMLARLRAAVAPGGRIVFLHHFLAFDDAATPPALVTEAVERAFARGFRAGVRYRTGRFSAVAFDR